MIMLPMVRFTVTVELTAPRLACRFWMNSVLIGRIVHAQAEGDVSRAGRSDQDHVVGLAADEEVADLGSSDRLDGRREQVASPDAKVVKFVALPPIRTSPICPVTAPSHVGDHVRAARQQAGRRARSGWRTGSGTSAAVVLPSISLAWNRLSRPLTRNVTLCWNDRAVGRAGRGRSAGRR